MKKIILVSLLSVALMSVVDGFINPEYGIKSMIKIVLFLMVPLISAKFGATQNMEALLKPAGKKELAISFGLGGTVYLVIIGVYMFLSPYIDLQGIKLALKEDLGVTRENFILVALYISFINSLLEEFFFRGYLFLGLLKITARLKAYTISALFFAIYHVAIIGSWFSPLIFVLAMTGLFVGGVIFNFLNEKNRNIINSWVVHMMANLAINTVGLIMFDFL
ncbi:CPBP family intramembrane glutamic endopeptidase [Gudongella sp. DL1XJH-153]|uniref:CPBP family intramembrane glutamic endopeptidase n=1 Tax=Gudongella sp. DL1XJH-153 TaxID=3409804 RepID=UPI003BB4E5CF